MSFWGSKKARMLDEVRELLAMGHPAYAGLQSMNMDPSWLGWLLDPRTDPAICKLCSSRERDLACWMIDNGHSGVSERRSDGSTPLMLAASNGDARLVELLLERGACPGDVDGEGRSALARARGAARAVLEAIELGSMQLAVQEAQACGAKRM